MIIIYLVLISINYLLIYSDLFYIQKLDIMIIIYFVLISSIIYLLIYSYLNFYIQKLLYTVLCGIRGTILKLNVATLRAHVCDVGPKKIFKNVNLFKI